MSELPSYFVLDRTEGNTSIYKYRMYSLDIRRMIQGLFVQVQQEQYPNRHIMAPLTISVSGKTVEAYSSEEIQSYARIYKLTEEQLRMAILQSTSGTLIFDLSESTN